MATYFSFLNPGDTILGMNLAHGGHLTPGSAVNFSGRLYRVVFYGVEESTGMIDMDSSIRTLWEEGIVSAAAAFDKAIDKELFQDLVAGNDT